MLLTLIRTVLLYALLILAVRLMGKRQVGEMEPAEFVVTMLVANLAAIPMQDGATPLYSGIVPIFAVLSMELILSCLSFRFLPFRKLLCGKPVILIWEGKVDQSALARTLITQDELTRQLRQQGVTEIEKVQYAILETNGQVSVFPYPQHAPVTAKDAGVNTEKGSFPVALVSDGKLLTENLRFVGKDAAWVHDALSMRHASLSSTWMLTLDSSGKTAFIPKEDEK